MVSDELARRTPTRTSNAPKRTRHKARYCQLGTNAIANCTPPQATTQKERRLRVPKKRRSTLLGSSLHRKSMSKGPEVSKAVIPTARYMGQSRRKKRGYSVIRQIVPKKQNGPIGATSGNGKHLRLPYLLPCLQFVPHQSMQANYSSPRIGSILRSILRLLRNKVVGHGQWNERKAHNIRRSKAAFSPTERAPSISELEADIDEGLPVISSPE